MKFNILLLQISVICFVFINAQAITYRAKNVETLVIFSFAGKTNESENIANYIDYFTELVSLWDVDSNFFDLSKIPLQLFFGDYNATELLNAADNENNTIAIIILKENQEFIDNVTIEVNDTSLSPTTKCIETHDLCNVIKEFIALPRDPLTKLNLVVFSNICPDSSIFEEFHAFKDDKILTETYLVTKATAEGDKTDCGINDKSILTKQFIFKNFKTVNAEDRNQLINPTIEQKSTHAENYLMILIKKENKKVAIKFIVDYYNDTTNCKFEDHPKNDKIKPYFITMVMKDENGNNNQLTTVIPAIDFNEASFTFEEYLIHNLEYELKNSKNSTSTFDNITQLLLTYINDPQQVAIFTDDYSYLENLNSLALPKDNRTINYILYLTSENQTIKERIERKFYQDEKIDKFKSFFYIMTPPKNGDDFGEHVCTRVTKAIPVGLLWWHWTLIGIGIFVLVIILVIFYNKCIRQKDPYATVMGNFPPENKEECLKECNKLLIKEGKFNINFNVVKGQGISSTVYEAIIKRYLLPDYPRKSFDNDISDDCIVAAKLLNQFEQDQIDYIVGEIQAARILEKHEKICTLLGCSTHLGAPCLFFEMMEQDLFSYIISLRQPISDCGDESASTLTISVTESEHYSVPDFDEKQEKIFLQILWQVSQGLEYIASKNIVHRDVAARNILISRYGDSETYAAKIADFGLCITVDEITKEFQASSNKGLPLKLCAIECHLEKIYSEASDIWAFGLLLIEVYSLSATLYPGIGTHDIPEYLKSGKRMPKPEKMPQDIYDIAFGCWKEDPNLRKPFYKLSKELKEKLRAIDPENDAYKDYWHLQIEDEELMESFIPRKVKTT